MLSGPDGYDDPDDESEVLSDALFDRGLLADADEFLDSRGELMVRRINTPLGDLAVRVYEAAQRAGVIA